MKTLPYIAIIILNGTLSCITHPTSGQSQYRFHHYSIKDGLASDYARNIVQDSLGYIWISHAGTGLSRFDGYSFKTFHYDATDSARSALDFVLGFLQTDAHGNVWAMDHKSTLADTRILAKYDAKTDRFVKHTIKLNGVGVRRFRFENDNSKIWMGTTNGLCSYEIRSRKIETFVNGYGSTDQQRWQNTVLDVKDFGSYLLLATDGGLWKFDKNSKTFARPECSPTDSAFFNQSPFMVFFDAPSLRNRNFLWLRSENSMFKIDSNFSILHRFDMPDSLTWEYSDWDKDEVFWFSGGEGSVKGLFRYNPKDRSLVNIRHDPKHNYSLLSNSVTEITVDREQNVWTCTQLGISKLKRDGLISKNVEFALPLAGGTLYQTPVAEYLVLAQQSEKRSDVFPRSNLLVAHLVPGNLSKLKFDNWLDVEVPHVATMFKGKRFLWVSAVILGVLGLPINSAGDTDMWTRPSGKSDPVYLLSPWQDEYYKPDGEHGIIKLSHKYFGKENIQHYSATSTDPNTLNQSVVTALWEDSKENLWVGQYALGLNKISATVGYGRDGSVSKYLHDPEDTTTIVSNTITAIYPEAENSFWVITPEGADLAHVHRDTHNVSFEHVFNNGEIPTALIHASDGTPILSTSEGLYLATKNNERYDFGRAILKEHILDVKEDSIGRLWLYTNRGLLCFDRKRMSSVLFGPEDGIDHTRATEQRPMYQSRNGTILMVDPFGVTIFDPKSFRIDSASVTPVFTELRIDNLPTSISETSNGGPSIQKNVNMLRELTLGYLHNNFSLEFSAMEMKAPEKNRYRHKLDGYDKDWIETDYKNRTATYTNLPAGDYTFRIKASNHHGVWSDQERTLKVKILPAPWRTSWAYIGYGLLFLGALYAARRNLLQRERLKANLKLEQIAREKEHFELEKAQEVDRVKTSFFTNISHEFRTPLTLIKGPVETLLDRFKDDPDVVQRLKLVQRNSDVLLRLINQLLDLAKLESGTMKVEKSNSDINSFIRAIAGSFESLARHKNVTLSVEISSDRKQVIFDKDKLETILINLINNAIKFTPTGGSVVVRTELRILQVNNETHSTGTPLWRRGAGLPAGLSVRNEEKAEGFAKAGGEVVVTVSDTGIGIPVEHQQKVFERFHQVSEAHKEIGTGIGLSLVKELIQLLEGTIDVSSEPGRGTTFTVIIPVEPGIKTSETVEELIQPLSISYGHSNNEFHAQPSHNGASELPHVLVVEDNDDLRAFIIDSLGQEFYFLEADNGRTGLEAATTEIPDLIISDVMMPEMDGITMAEKIKGDVRTSHIPLILLTAKSTEASKLTGLESGADDYLTKPFNKHELLLKIRNAISRQRKLREKVMAELMSEAPRKEVLSADEQFLTKVKEEILNQLSNEQLSVESLAEQIGMSRVHLYRKISGLTGMSVNELIRKLRLHRAAQLLEQRWGPVSQVAYEVGFSNLSYFSKVFKEEFGVLPSEYNSVKI